MHKNAIFKFSIHLSERKSGEKLQKYMENQKQASGESLNTGVPKVQSFALLL